MYQPDIDGEIILFGDKIAGAVQGVEQEEHIVQMLYIASAAFTNHLNMRASLASAFSIRFLHLGQPASSAIVRFFFRHATR